MPQFNKTLQFKLIFDYRNLSESPIAKRINQFPFENVVTVKDLLSIVSRRMKSKESDVNRNGQNGESLNCSPKWLPVTFNLKTEIPKFVSYYQQREKL